MIGITVPPLRCGICGTALDGEDPLSRDCGGDCLQCMALVAEDPDCQPEVWFRLGYREASAPSALGDYPPETVSWERVSSSPRPRS